MLLHGWCGLVDGRCNGLSACLSALAPWGCEDRKLLYVPRRIRNRIRFCTLWTLMIFESEAVPHICMQYVNEGTTIDLYSNILLLRLSSLVPLSIQFSFLLPPRKTFVQNHAPVLSLGWLRYDCVLEFHSGENFTSKREVAVLRLISVYRDVPSIRPFAIQFQKVLCDLSCFNSTRGVDNEGCVISICSQEGTQFHRVWQDSGIPNATMRYASSNASDGRSFACHIYHKSSF